MNTILKRTRLMMFFLFCVCVMGSAVLAASAPDWTKKTKDVSAEKRPARAEASASGQKGVDDANDVNDDADEHADNDAQTKAFLRARFPRLSETAQKMKEENPERYRQFMERARRLRNARTRFESAEEKEHPRLQAIRSRIAEILQEQEALREKLHTLHTAYRAAAADAKVGIMADIRAVVAKAFDLTTERRNLELEERTIHLQMLQERVKEEKAALEARVAQRDVHIEKYVKSMTTRSENTSAPSHSK